MIKMVAYKMYIGATAVLVILLYAAILTKNSSIEKDIEAGNTLPILDWLRNNIHKHGRYHTSEDLCKQATGEVLNSSHFITCVTKKYTDIYNL
jgi:carboxypeptidase Taq